MYNQRKMRSVVALPLMYFSGSQPYSWNLPNTAHFAWVPLKWKVAFLSCHIFKHHQRPFKYEGSLESSLCIMSFTESILKNASSISSTSSSHPQLFAHIPIFKRVCPISLCKAIHKMI